MVLDLFDSARVNLNFCIEVLTRNMINLIKKNYEIESSIDLRIFLPTSALYNLFHNLSEKYIKNTAPFLILRYEKINLIYCLWEMNRGVCSKKKAVKQSKVKTQFTHPLPPRVIYKADSLNFRSRAQLCCSYSHHSVY